MGLKLPGTLVYFCCPDPQQMKKIQWLAILMGVAILGITGFQLYWLKQNYAREKNTLGIKTETAFRETVMRLQASKLKLGGMHWDEKTGGPAVKVFMSDDDEKNKVRVAPRQEIISSVNIIRDKLRDSMELILKDSTGKKDGKKMVISMTNSTVDVHGDSTMIKRHLPRPPGDADVIFNLLYGVDSLQDSLRIVEIDSAFARRLQEEKINIPFSVIRKDSVTQGGDHARNKVIVGFARPVVYEMKLGNSFPYLLRQITQPILFSILLLGITLLSFVLLYKNLLKQQRLAELKNEFISNITHELKTPIATVGVAIEALKNFNAMDNPQRTREYLDISGNELQRLSLLVDKVLKLSMFEKKEIELKYEPVNLYDLVQEVTASLKLQLEKYRATVTVTQEGGANLQGDRLHLVSVIFNLLDNALKYGKENPEILVQIKGDENHVELRFTDNGIGIPAAYRDKIFEKFFRIPHGDTHNARGYGLGLSYAAQVIKKHHGTIRVESEEGQGTAFIITLPKTITT